MPFNAPHGPLQAKADDLEKYRHLADEEPGFGGNPKNRQKYGAGGRGKSRRQTLAAMISRLDDGVGRILDTLSDSGLDNNTIVWFFSDNGGVPPGDNRLLHGRKGTVLEGGIRVAAGVRWPDKIAAGSRIDVPLAYIDVLPTLMRVAGIESHGGKPLDGIDAVDVLTGKTTQLSRDLYSYIGQEGEAKEKIALIESEWKLVVNGPRINNDSIPVSRRETLLFRITSDPYEQNNLAEDNAEVVERMWKKLVTFRSLQTAGAVPAYNSRDDAFKPPHQWRIPGAPASEN